MTTSRKLIVATLLLAGGYAVAFVLGSLAELVIPAADSPSTTVGVGGTLSALNGRAAANGNGAAATLIPESEFAADNAANHPTWLTATHESSVAELPASQPAFAAAPTLNDDWPIVPVSFAGSPSPPVPSPPKARITNVLATANETTTRAASPWDRWPRWDASGAATKSGPVAATFQDRAAAGPQIVPVGFDHAEVVRRNSPPLDQGAAASGASGRMHVVVDGDSLSKLAERYLDDPALGDEIYRLNRDVLGSPELLPIGVELRIPDGRTADLSMGFSASQSVAAAKPVIPSGMVPVEWTPRSFDEVPRAELLRPIPAGRDN